MMRPDSEQPDNNFQSELNLKDKEITTFASNKSSMKQTTLNCHSVKIKKTGTEKNLNGTLILRLGRKNNKPMLTLKDKNKSIYVLNKIKLFYCNSSQKEMILTVS